MRPLLFVQGKRRAGVVNARNDKLIRLPGCAQLCYLRGGKTPGCLGQLFYRKGKVGFGIGLLRQSKVPPFAAVRFEAMPDHDIAEQLSVVQLFRRKTGIIGTGYAVEEVEAAAHIQFPARLSVKKRQIHRASPAVSRPGCNIAAGKKFGFVQAGIKMPLHPGIRVSGPTAEVRNGGLRTVGVINLETITPGSKFVAGSFQGLRGLFREQGAGFLIAHNALSDKVICRVVAHFQNRIGYGVRQHHKARRIVGERCRTCQTGLRRTKAYKQGGSCQADCGHP